MIRRPSGAKAQEFLVLFGKTKVVPFHRTHSVRSFSRKHFSQWVRHWTMAYSRSTYDGVAARFFDPTDDPPFSRPCCSDLRALRNLRNQPVVSHGVIACSLLA